LSIDPFAFVSYSREDVEFALRLARELKATGQKVWMDKLDLRPGQRWENEVDTALHSCSRVLVILSPSSVDSSNVMAEAGFALDERKKLIPVMYRDCRIPFRLRPIQYADFRRSYEEGFNELITSLTGAHMTAVASAPVEISTAATSREGANVTAVGPRPPGDADSKPSATRAGSMEGHDFARRVPRRNYLIIAALGFLFGVAFTLFYIYQVPRLVESGVQGQIFYVLLIPWALSCAVFLFGAMKGYAHLAYKRLGISLELGGPIVLFCLVLVGGFRLVPPAPETFDLAVRAHSKDTPLLTSGQITLDLPGLPHANIGPDGEANFKGISARFKGMPIKVLARVDGYQEKWLAPKVEGNILDVELEKAHPMLTFIGAIVPPPGPGEAIKILVDGQEGETSADDLGRFKLNVNGKAGDKVRVEVYKGTELIYDDYQVLPGPARLILRKLRREPER